MTIAPSHFVHTPARLAADQAARLRTLADARARAAEPTHAQPAERRAKIVTIGSGKGGVGKTAIAVNVAIALARQGLRVTVVDGDLGTANVDVVCGLSPTRRLESALRADARNPGPARLDKHSFATPLGFRLVAGIAGIGSGADLSADERRRLAEGLHTLADEADVVIVDAGAGIGVGVRSLMHAADFAIIVATPEPASIADAYGLFKSMRLDATRSAQLPMLVLNQVGSDLERDRVHERLNAVALRFLKAELGLLGAVRWDRDAMLAARLRKPLLAIDGKSHGRNDLRTIAAQIARQTGIACLQSDRAGSGAARRAVPVR